jgi:hypothetical protein
LVTDSTPSSVTAGGGVFIAHVCGSNVLFDQFGCFGFFATLGPRFENRWIARKRRTLLAFQASRVLENSMIFVGS